MCNDRFDWSDDGRTLLSEMVAAQRTVTSLEFKNELRQRVTSLVHQADAGAFLRQAYADGELPGYTREYNGTYHTYSPAPVVDDSDVDEENEDEDDDEDDDDFGL
jgi:hypothetical protein